MIVKNIQVKKNSVLISFKEKVKSISLDFNSYTNERIYINKEIDEKTYIRLKRLSKLNKSMNQAIKYCLKKLRTSFEVKQYLKRKQLSYKDINYIIRYLEDNGLLNDENYVASFISEANENNMGKNYIIHHLYKVGISYSLISNIVFEDDNEREKMSKKYKLYTL